MTNYRIEVIDWRGNLIGTAVDSGETEAEAVRSFIASHERGGQKPLPLSAKIEATKLADVETQ